MYGKCGSLVGARKVLDHLTEPNIFSWNIVISAYRSLGFPQEALQLFTQMQRQACIQSDHFTFSTIIPVCANLASVKHGLQIHGKIIRCGFQCEVIVMITLVDMYAKCGRMEKARELFDKMHSTDVVSCTVMIMGYAQNGVLDKALRLFYKVPNRDVALWTAMITACVQNGALDLALKFFEEMPQRNVVSWTAIISGYVQNGYSEKALEIFNQV
ncbi:putative pentatricopeptide repeat-containing protein At3g13770, mitochondrial [Cryptomeria japonica]|uniref:putative pentatricopeptide repeat-containing protein At3g13770, mitochondrial n=1 Tax=Cryptomeria japonica TaxID=3369 RepID=UPI0027D9F910|nr:putative pentatricopeptide repeat-containing protein At3g13770, mitochondrial [Cryptomeria japonica]